jgi:hypothetical protein
VLNEDQHVQAAQEHGADVEEADREDALRSGRQEACQD